MLTVNCISTINLVCDYVMFVLAVLKNYKLQFVLKYLHLKHTLLLWWNT